ncbi:MAG: hypothetical protein AB7S80_16740 [Rhizobiaceae bacterium]
MIITDRFLATHKKPAAAGKFCWRFMSKANPHEYYELNFLPSLRRFTATRVQYERAGHVARALSERDAQKLRQQLSEEDVIACTMAALETRSAR